MGRIATRTHRLKGRQRGRQAEMVAGERGFGGVEVVQQPLVAMLKDSPRVAAANIVGVVPSSRAFSLVIRAVAGGKSETLRVSRRADNDGWDAKADRGHKATGLFRPLAAVEATIGERQGCVLVVFAVERDPCPPVGSYRVFYEDAQGKGRCTDPFKVGSKPPRRLLTQARLRKLPIIAIMREDPKTREYAWLVGANADALLHRLSANSGYMDPIDPQIARFAIPVHQRARVSVAEVSGEDSRPSTPEERSVKDLNDSDLMGAIASLKRKLAEMETEAVARWTCRLVTPKVSRTDESE